MIFLRLTGYHSLSQMGRPMVNKGHVYGEQLEMNEKGKEECIRRGNENQIGRKGISTETLEPRLR